MNKYKIIVKTDTGSNEFIRKAETMAEALEGFANKPVVSVTSDFSLCKCCAENSDDFPKVLCRQQPYGDEETVPVLYCNDYITEEQKENILSMVYKTYTKEQWHNLTHSFRNAFIEGFK